jgi:predicted nucleotidyltransferase component of viral defense system
VISKREIDEKSAELGVHVSHIQRDYVFGWILAGLYQPDNPLSPDLILKGGNAFRKGYFGHARYSNDLDFSTLVEVEEEELSQAIQFACARAATKSGAEIGVRQTRIDSRIVAGEEGCFTKRASTSGASTARTMSFSASTST